MPTTFTGRTSITPTVYTGRVKTGDFAFQTWDESSTAWDSLTFTWDTWGTGIPVTTYTARTPI